MDEDEIRTIVRAVLQELTPEPAPEPPPPELAPHRVKHKGKVIEPIDGEKGGSRYVGALDCPDCGMGLASGSGAPDEMICMRLVMRRAKLPPGEGGIVACGLKE